MIVVSVSPGSPQQTLRLEWIGRIAVLPPTSLHWPGLHPGAAAEPHGCHFMSPHLLHSLTIMSLNVLSHFFMLLDTIQSKVYLDKCTNRASFIRGSVKEPHNIIANFSLYQSNYA